MAAAKQINKIHPISKIIHPMNVVNTTAANTAASILVRSILRGGSSVHRRTAKSG